jgi:transcriptional regulator with XRE-family HTH domain
LTLREFLTERGIPMDAAAILGGVDTATISRVAAGKSRPRPQTVVRLARAFGVSARRMQSICSASWEAAHPAAHDGEDAA